MLHVALVQGQNEKRMKKISMFEKETFFFLATIKHELFIIFNYSASKRQKQKQKKTQICMLMFVQSFTDKILYLYKVALCVIDDKWHVKI